MTSLGSEGKIRVCFAPAAYLYSHCDQWQLGEAEGLDLKGILENNDSKITRIYCNASELFANNVYVKNRQAFNLNHMPYMPKISPLMFLVSSHLNE